MAVLNDKEKEKEKARIAARIAEQSANFPKRLSLTRAGEVVYERPPDIERAWRAQVKRTYKES